MNNHLKKEVIALLKSLREDAQMALDGDWGVAEWATDEQKEGFTAQIESINKMLDKLKNEK